MKYYTSIEHMRSQPQKYADPFIVQWEIPNPKDSRERVYLIFDGISEYIRCIGRYSTCHEVFVSPTLNANDDIIAHPVFDIDKKYDDPMPYIVDNIGQYIPFEYKEMMQNDIIDILCVQYPDMAEKIKSLTNLWVWMTSPSKKKISKHLVIKGITFSMWRSQMKLLVQDMKKLDRPYISMIDDAILRKLGSLRLPLNSKRHKYDTTDPSKPTIVEYSPILKFDNPEHTFIDGLVLIHSINMATTGILLTPADLDPKYQDMMLDIIPVSMGEYIAQPDEDDISQDELIAAFNKIDKLHNTGLYPGIIQGKYLPLIRKFPGKCPISGKVHENENAYVYKLSGKICFSCHRGCSIHREGKDYKYVDITSYPKKSSDSLAYEINSKLSNDMESP